jgi:DNA-binding beta-propeller fold protein YncE
MECAPLAAQEIPMATAISGNPFFVKKTWYIGGAGHWDYLTIDSSAQLLYIAHGAVVQVVNIETGALVAQISGFREAHDIALDDTGTYAYVSDGQADAVDVVDRRKLAIESSVPVHCSPRSVAIERSSGLLFAICGAVAVIPSSSAPPNLPRTAESNRPTSPAEKQEQLDSRGTSHVVVIDTGTKTVIADITIPGDFRFAQSDGNGRVYVSVGETEQTWEDNGKIVHENFPQRIARLNGPAIASTVQQLQNAQPQSASASKEPVHIDWRSNQNASQNSGLDLRFIPLRANCANPRGLAVDGKHLRLFLACDKQRLLVLNAGTGDAVASLTTGPGDNVLGYDQEHGLVFVANGSGYGSLTIVKQDATTDSYEVVQNLPTRERARTLAVDPSTGDVYLVTDTYGVDLTKPGTIGTMQAAPISGSFHVLVVGH